MCNEDETVWVSFNGEIFNYVELGEELRRRGHRFRTASDTEVIVHAWEEWGEDCFDRFNGQWAIALWDRRERAAGAVAATASACARSTSRRTPAGSAVRLRGQGAVRRPGRRPRASTPPGSTRCFTYWSHGRPAHGVPPASSSSSRATTRCFDRDGVPHRALLEHRLPRPGRRAGAGHRGQRRARCASGSSRRPGCGSCAATCPVGAYLSGGSTPRSPPRSIARYTDAPLHTFSLRFADARVRRGRLPAADGRPSSAPRTTRSSSAPPTSPRSSPRSCGTPRRPLLRAAPAPLFLLSQAGARTTATRSSSPARAPTRCSAATTSSARRRVRAVLGRATPARPCATGRSSCSTRGWRARPGSAPAFARSFFGQDLDPDDPAMSHRPRWDSTAALKAHAHARPAGPAGADRGRTSCRRMPAGSARLGPAQPRPVAGDDDAPAGLHPGLARATGC